MFLCIHKRSLVHAQHYVHALGQGPQGPGTQKGAGPVPGPGPRLFWVPGPWGPWPRACTRALCMHKRSLVYTQGILLCIHNKCINVTPGAMLRYALRVLNCVLKIKKYRFMRKMCIYVFF